MTSDAHRDKALDKTGVHVRLGDSEVQRRVSVKGSGGVAATVIVTARRGKVWVSIEPPFHVVCDHGAGQGR